MIEALPDEAERRIAAGERPAWVVAEPADLEAISARTGLAAERVGRISGINLSKGTEVEIVIARFR